VILIVSVISYFLSGIIGYRVVAYLLLVTLSILALFFDVFPVLLAAFLSALIWDFFFIPPHFTFRVDNTEDAFLLIMYFIIAMVHSVLTFKIRQIQKEAGKKEEKANTLKLYNTLLNSLSHELRTPIATIIGASDNLLMNANKLTEENKSNLLSEISVASLRLNQQVENLLNMSRLESGFIQIKKDWCDINEVIYAAIKRLEENIKEHVVPPRINLMFKKVVEDMVANKEVNVISRYESLQRNNAVGDFQFIVMEKFLSRDNELAFFEKLILQMYFWIKDKSLSEEKGFGLEQSNVTVEQFPLIVAPVSKLRLKRVYNDE